MAFKLWKGNFDDNMQMLHMILFGKKAKTIELSCLYSHKDRRQTLTNFGFRMSRKNKRQKTTVRKEELSAKFAYINHRNLKKLCECCNGLALGKVQERSRKVATVIQNTSSIVLQETYLLRVLEELILLL
ncbi:hypothetical protein V6N11_081794 [Hibiscus sabdariffa]|uniref:Uncharacterized protein n=1 Tax=Hibiscus sabdariffa TaxID=183260 RepID=A0ABR2Q772_9ROSI